jgi:hypothetical protein
MTQDKLTTIKLCVLSLAVSAASLLGLNINRPNAVTAEAGQAQSGAANQTANDKLVWLDNYDAALAEAKKTGKPIFLEFRCAP